MKKDVCLIGGTGLIGSLLLTEMQKNASVEKIYFLGRRAPKNKEKVEFLKIELFEISEFHTISADHWFCCLGTTIKTAGSTEAFRKVDYHAVLEFAELAKKSNAKSLHIVSALGADEQSSVFYNKTKGQMESQVRKLEIPSINFYRPSLLLGQREEFRPAEKLAILITPLIKPFLKGPFKKFMPIKASKVAISMIKNMDDPKSGVHFFENQDML